MKFMAFMSNKLIKFPLVSYFKNRTTFHMFFFGGRNFLCFKKTGGKVRDPMCLGSLDTSLNGSMDHHEISESQRGKPLCGTDQV